MNTQNTTPGNNNTKLFQVGSSIPSFSTKEEYLSFIKDWKLTYKLISNELRMEKMMWRLNPARSLNIGEAKRKHYDEIATRAQAAVNQLVDANPELRDVIIYAPKYWSTSITLTPENTGNPATKSHVVFGNVAVANWLLILRRQAKLQNAQK